MKYFAIIIPIIAFVLVGIRMMPLADVVAGTVLFVWINALIWTAVLLLVWGWILLLTLWEMIHHHFFGNRI